MFFYIPYHPSHKPSLKTIPKKQKQNSPWPSVLMHDLLTSWVSRIMPSQHENINHKMALYKIRALYLLRTSEHSTQNKEGVTASRCLRPELHIMESSLLWERRGSGFSSSGPHIPIFPGPLLQCFMLQYHRTYSSQNAYCWWRHKSSSIPLLLPSVICSVPVPHQWRCVNHQTYLLHQPFPTRSHCDPRCPSLCTFSAWKLSS